MTDQAMQAFLEDRVRAALLHADGICLSRTASEMLARRDREAEQRAREKQYAEVVARQESVLADMRRDRRRDLKLRMVTGAEIEAKPYFSGPAKYEPAPTPTLPFHAALRNEAAYQESVEKARRLQQEAAWLAKQLQPPSILLHGVPIEFDVMDEALSTFVGPGGNTLKEAVEEPLKMRWSAALLGCDF